ncbi:AMP-binding protein [Nakamurella sp. YIM 132087]|uniref:AMP-binding protein n=1 Tax=Nakamurella alba TaxID=2665158 RepID=A0A7K1FP45_9ACTN|nr:class I adenylate-forming enzyme family protein [Nakamurella alba]MTD14584.1 AMP-binding protein [Nakamurella alba]
MITDDQHRGPAAIDQATADQATAEQATAGRSTFDRGTFDHGTFDRLWDDTVAAHGSSTFLLFHDAGGTVTRWTYAEFDAAVADVAGTLARAGVGPGTPVHLVLRNCPAFVAIWLAVARLGAWMVPVDPASTARDIDRQVRRIGPAVAFVAAADSSAERSAAFAEGAAGRVGTVVELTEDAGDLAPGSPLRQDAGTHSARVGGPQPSDRLAVMFTSGTTSEPKGVELTQANYVAVAAGMATAAGLRAEHRWFVTLPLFHANAQYYCFAPAIAVGASVALTSTFSASGWVPQARALEVTHASLFAAPIRMILARCPAEEAPLRLGHVWYAQSLGVEHHRRFGELVGTAPRQLYGMTETICIVTYDRSEPPQSDVIGTPADRRVRLIDPVTGEEAGTGVPGEMHVHGERGRDLFAGYLDAPEINARVFEADTDGTETWFRTGDLAQADDDGTLRFVGRIDDVIKVSGENVSLTEVEAAIAQAPGVLEAAVVAQPDPVRDQVPIAYVVPKDLTDPPAVDDLIGWATKNLAPAARPRGWHVIDALPRTSVGKVRRFKVTEATAVDTPTPTP